MIEDIEAITEKIRKYVKKSVGQARYEHSLMTAETCRKLCKKYGFDEKKGYLAGIAHDMCKKSQPEEILALAAKDGKEISELEMENSKNKKKIQNPGKCNREKEAGGQRQADNPPCR